MSSSNANSDEPVYLEVADPCIACVNEMCSKTRVCCMADFKDESTENTSEEGSYQNHTTKKCKRCTDKNTGKKTPCVGVPGEAKELAEQVIVATKKVRALKSKMAEHVITKNGTLDMKTKRRIQRALIEPLQERIDAAMDDHEKKAQDFQALKKKLGSVGAMGKTRIAEDKDAHKKWKGDEWKTKEPIPEPTSAQPSANEEHLGDLRSAIKTFNHALNEVNKAQRSGKAAFEKDQLDTETKKKFDNLVVKLHWKAGELWSEVDAFTMSVQENHQLDLGARLRYDSGDEDVSYLDGVETGGEEDNEDGDDDSFIPQGGDTEMTDAT